MVVSHLILWFCAQLFAGIGSPSSCILGNSWEHKETDIITALQEGRGVEPEQWKEGRISCLGLDGFCFLIIQELLLLQLGDPDSGSTKSSPTNIFKRDVHKLM